VICGHLAPDLLSLADSLLFEAGENETEGEDEAPRCSRGGRCR